MASGALRRARQLLILGQSKDIEANNWRPWWRWEVLGVKSGKIDILTFSVILS